MSSFLNSEFLKFKAEKMLKYNFIFHNQKKYKDLKYVKIFKLKRRLGEISMQVRGSRNCGESSSILPPISSRSSRHRGVQFLSWFHERKGISHMNVEFVMDYSR